MGLVILKYFLIECIVQFVDLCIVALVSMVGRGSDINNTYCFLELQCSPNQLTLDRLATSYMQLHTSALNETTRQVFSVYIACREINIKFKQSRIFKCPLNCSKL